LVGLKILGLATGVGVQLPPFALVNPASENGLRESGLFGNIFKEASKYPDCAHNCARDKPSVANSN
jgi:hypothetical protein